MLESVYDEFARKLASAVRTESLEWDGRRSRAWAADQRSSGEKVESHIVEGLPKGATALTGGKRHALGYGVFEPSVVMGVKPDMKASTEEAFGPLVTLFKFSSDEEVVDLSQ